MTLKDADKAARELEKILDADSRAHHARTTDSIIDTKPIKYFVLRELVTGYQVLRGHQLETRKLLKQIRIAGETIDWYQLDEG